jgi:hypothetical protein
MKYLNDTGLAHLWDKILEVAGDEIYIGTTAPAAGSDYKVWINSSDSLVNVPTLAQVQGLGYQTAAQVQSAINTAIGGIENGTY